MNFTKDLHEIYIRYFPYFFESTQFNQIIEVNKSINIVLNKYKIAKEGKMAYMKQTITILMLVLLANFGNANLKDVQILGFQTWQEPTPDQIKEQFAQLTQEYRQNPNKDAATEEKFKKVRLAYQSLKQRNFIINDGGSNNQKGLNTRQRSTSQSGQYESSGRNQRRRPYEPRYKSSSFNFNVDDILRSMDQQYEKLKRTNDENYENSRRNIEQHFFQWLLTNPIVIIAALLISIGLINLCTCCFLIKNIKKSQKQQGQQGDKKKQNRHKQPTIQSTNAQVRRLPSQSQPKRTNTQNRSVQQIRPSKQSINANKPSPKNVDTASEPPSFVSSTVFQSKQSLRSDQIKKQQPEPENNDEKPKVE